MSTGSYFNNSLSLSSWQECISIRMGFFLPFGLIMLEFFQPYYLSVIWSYSLYINLENASHIYFLLHISVEDTRHFFDITRYKFVDSMGISNSFGFFSGVFLHNTRQFFLKLYCHTKHPRFFPIMILRYIWGLQAWLIPQYWFFYLRIRKIWFFYHLYYIYNAIHLSLFIACIQLDYVIFDHFCSIDYILS